MLFSIIVPVYNVERYLKECVDSILHQTYKDFEIILVDDGSTDSSGRICDEYEKSNPCIKTIHKKNGGLSSAWIEGLNYIHGQYVCSIDSDDYIENDLLEKTKNTIEEYSPEVIVFGYKSVLDSRHIIQNTIRAEGGFYDKERIVRELLPELINVGCIVNRSNIYLSRINKIVKKELLLSNTRYYRNDISYGEDNMWTIPNVLSAESIYIFDQYYPYCYRYNPTSITHKYNKNLWEKFSILDDLIAEVIEESDYPDLQIQLLRDCAFHGIMTINNEMNSNNSAREKIKHINEIINTDTVVKGIQLMDYSKCSTKEIVNILLVRMRNPLLIFLYKSLSNTLRK